MIFDADADFSLFDSYYYGIGQCPYDVPGRRQAQINSDHLRTVRCETTTVQCRSRPVSEALSLSMLDARLALLILTLRRAVQMDHAAGSKYGDSVGVAVR